MATTAVAGETVVYSCNMDADPGWWREGEWEFGTPTGGGGTLNGYPDPTAGHTGANVFGVNLAGDYHPAGGPWYLTTWPINCSGRDRVILRFWRWLNTDSISTAYAGVEVSTDRLNWTYPWYNANGPVTDSGWTQVSINISSVAANQPTVYIRWGFMLAEGAPPYSGWNIDDVELVQPTVTIKPESFRGLWADAFQAGFKSDDEINTLVELAAKGNYNAIIAEVMAYQDNGWDGHGAYWASNIVPRATDNGGIDSLARLIERAHARGIEVHAWILPYRICKAWPPSGNDYLKDHPEYFMTSLENMGTLATVGNAYVLDPGSPEAQEHTASIVKELVSRYAIDGLHLDYVRFESVDAGYPTVLSNPNSGLARFRRITGYQGTPTYYNEPLWDDFRRREVTELVRRLRAEIAAIRTDRQQPLRFTAAVISGGNSVDFTLSYAYLYCYQDWATWLQQGYLDGACPMIYKREHCPAEAEEYRRWVDAGLDWKGPRHYYPGQATYLNSFENSSRQLEYARTAGADGSVTYSYAGTRANETICDDNDGWSTDPAWFDYVSQAAFREKRAIPPMPWRNPNEATEGTLYGRVTDAATGKPIDNAGVQVPGLPIVRTDGNGFYVTTLLTAEKAGTPYSVTASNAGLSRTHEVLVFAGDVHRNDFVLGPTAPPVIAEPPTSISLCPETPWLLTVVPQGEEVSLRWRKDGVDLTDDGHYGGAQTDRLSISAVGPTDVGSYACFVVNSAGSVESAPASLTLKPATLITAEPEPVGVQLHSNASFAVAATGLRLSYQWKKNGTVLADTAEIMGATAPALRILNVTASDLGTYECEITGECGSAVSSAVSLYLAFAPGDFDADGDLDIEDFGELQKCLSGVGTPQTDFACRKTLLDEDGDVDLDDVAIFLRCLSGPGVPAKTNCAGN